MMVQLNESSVKQWLSSVKIPLNGVELHGGSVKQGPSCTKSQLQGG